ncbi:MAG: response regulator [bacterium]|nr:response regulator [bacterium]
MNPTRILIVEDEHFISELYTRALQKAGYNVTVAADGINGFQQIMTNTYDIALLDIMLPNLNGIEALKEIRAKTVNNPLKTKIIIATNLDQEDQKRESIEKLADGYLVKAEITPRQLVEFLAHLNS